MLAETCLTEIFLVSSADYCLVSFFVDVFSVGLVSFGDWSDLSNLGVYLEPETA